MQITQKDMLLKTENFCKWLKKKNLNHILSHIIKKKKHLFYRKTITKIFGILYNDNEKHFKK